MRQGAGTGAAEMDGLFVDDTPQAPVVNGRAERPRTRSKRTRPSERRRAEGFEQEPVAGADTALGQRGGNPSGAGPDIPSASRLSYAAGVLTCVKGTEEGLALNLIEGTYTIGRGRDNNFVLKDIAASRAHLKIEVHDNCVTVTDMKSGNGSRVNGRRIRNAVLNDGDHVEIGNTSLRFEYHGNDLSREIDHTPMANGRANGQADSQKRQPTQERIAEAAERLAAELSERIRQEDDFDDIATAQIQSHPPQSLPIGPPLVPTPEEQNGSLVEAIDNMVKDMSNPGASLQVSELWNETATHVPLSDVIPADDPRRPHAAPAMRPNGGAPPPMPPPSGPGFTAPPPTPAHGHAPPPYPGPAAGRTGTMPPVAAHYSQEPPRKSNALLISLMVFFFIVTVGVGGFAAWYFLWPMLDGGPVVSKSTQAEYATEIANAAMAIADKKFGEAEKHARKALEFSPGDAEATSLLKKIREMRGDKKKPKGKTAPGPGTAEKSKKDNSTSTTKSKSKSEAKPKKAAAAKPKPKPVKKAEPKKAAKKAAPKKAAPKKAAKKPAPKKAAPKPKPKPKPKPAPVKKKASGLSDAQAKKAMKSALRLKREDPEAACDQFKKIARSGPADSVWVTKAKTWAGRCR